MNLFVLLLHFKFVILFHQLRSSNKQSFTKSRCGRRNTKKKIVTFRRYRFADDLSTRDVPHRFRALSPDSTHCRNNLISGRPTAYLVHRKPKTHKQTNKHFTNRAVFESHVQFQTSVGCFANSRSESQSYLPTA